MSSDPAIRKYSNTLRARLAMKDASLSGTFTQAHTENVDQDLAYDYVGGFTRLFVPIGKKMSVKADFRRYSLENDSVFVDVVEQTAPAGLSAGLTYPQAFPTAFPATFDFVRDSSMNRTPTEFGVELGAQPAKRTFLRFGYGFQAIEREFYEVEKTTTNTLYVAGRSAISKQVNTRFRVQFEDTKDPCLHHKAAIPAVLQPTPSPGHSPLTGLQYYTMYQSRQADLTSFPTPQPLRRGHDHGDAERAAGHHRALPLARQRERRAQLLAMGAHEHSPGMDIWFATDDKWALTAGVRLPEGDAGDALQHARLLLVERPASRGASLAPAPTWPAMTAAPPAPGLASRPIPHRAQRCSPTSHGTRERHHHGLRLRRRRVHRTARRARLPAAIGIDGRVLESGSRGSA